MQSNTSARIPMFSIVTPTHNRSELLQDAIQSVLAQTLDDLELLIVDDASTDDTAATVSSFNDPRIRYIHRETSGGASAARNTGLENARGQFISLLDDDDELMPKFLEATYQCFENAPDSMAMAFTNVIATSIDKADEAPIQDKVIDHGDIIFDSATGSSGDLLTICKLATSWGITVRRKAAIEIGGFDTQLAISEDRDFFIRLLAAGHGARSIREPLVRFRAHTGERLTDLRKTNVKAKCNSLLMQKSAPFLKRFPDAYALLSEDVAGDLYRVGRYREARNAAWQAVRFSKKPQLRSWRRLIKSAIKAQWAKPDDSNAV